MKLIYVKGLYLDKTFRSDIEEGPINARNILFFKNFKNDQLYVSASKTAVRGWRLMNRVLYRKHFWYVNKAPKINI
uniref:Uncharacterized protein n=2 Tax=Lepeophtheirus salmonis TaxID=72036 RepID=A0A0K2T4R4_LEPSM